MFNLAILFQCTRYPSMYGCIGFDAAGNSAPGVVGVRIRNSNRNIVGGSSRNAIGYTFQGGIDIVGGSYNSVSENSIGATYGGEPGYGNGNFGVRVGSNPGGPLSIGNVVSGNVIASSGAPVDTRTGRDGEENRFSGNRFIAAGGIGAIVLVEDDAPVDRHQAIIRPEPGPAAGSTSGI